MQLLSAEFRMVCIRSNVQSCWEKIRSAALERLRIENATGALPFQ
jgi:hypothetical protein